MSGIAGFISPGRETRFEAELGGVLAQLRHRGPDGQGTALSTDPEAPGTVGLAHARLSILDLSAAGHQPMVTADGRWTVTCDGRICNYRELRAELESKGHRFRSQSDTEVLLAGFAEWGPALLPRLIGMFAFAIHDRLARRVTLARDPFGIKPLYYAVSGETVVFASELPAVLEFARVSREVDPQRYHDFLLSGSTDFGEGTLFAHVRQLPAGHFLEVPIAAPGSGRPVRYWQPDLSQRVDCSFEDAAEQVREAFLESMGYHLRSEAPLGFSLSGGNDSSAIVMAARGLLGPSAELHTFSFLPEDPRINEEQHIDVVIAAAGAHGHKLTLAPQELRRDIERLAAVQAEPFASPVIYAQYRIFQLARECGIKVMLGGEGADELLAGYERYPVAHLASLLRQRSWGSLRRALRRPAAPSQGGQARALRTALWLALPGGISRPARAFWGRRRGAHDWLSDAWFAERGVSTGSVWAPAGPYVMRELLDHDLRESQVPAMVRFEDRSAMSFSLENRVPFLNTRLVQLLFSLPEEYLVAPDGTRKAVFRRAMRGMVPDPILDRRDKIGFSVPAIDWFDTLRPWIAGRLEHVIGLGGLNGPALTRRWHDIGNGAHQSNPLLVWRCVSMSLWAERFGAVFN